MPLELNWEARQASLTPLFIEASIYAGLTNKNFQILATKEIDDFSSIISTSESALSLTLTNTTGNKIVESKNRRNYRFKRRQHDSFKKMVQAKYNTNTETEAKKKEYKKANERSAKVYRSYKSGDLPDIEITNQELIKTLQILAKVILNLESRDFIPCSVFSVLMLRLYLKFQT